MAQQRKRLGDYLVDEGRLTEDQLKSAIEEQKKTGQYLGAVLLSLGFCSEEEICKALSYLHGIPFIDLRDYQVSSEALDSIPAHLARECKVVPLSLNGSTLTAAMVDPMDFNIAMKIETTCNVTLEAFYATESAIDSVLESEYGSARQSAPPPVESSTIKSLDLPGETEEFSGSEPSVIDISAPTSADEPSAAVKIVEATINDAITQKSTDIHIEPTKNNVAVRFRVDGLLFDQTPIPLKHCSAVIARIKIMANMDIAEKRLPQGGRIQTELNGVEFDLRVSSFPTIYGEKIVIRLLTKDSTLLRLTNLGMTEKEAEIFEDLGTRPNGIMLVTGPTGSGKTTSLYALLNTIYTTHKNIHTLEDPVEYRLDGINQTQINPKADLTFASSLREMMRQDPDVIMIGEIRDPETAEIAIHASLTGHLVISTLHTNSSAAAVARLTNMGVENYLIASSIIGILAQRLARCLCDRCKQEDVAGRVVFERYNEPLEDDTKIYKAVGCRHCHNSGYAGRRGIYEILLPDEEIQDLIIKEAPAHIIEKCAVEKQNMKTLVRAGFEVVREGVSSLEEVLRIVH